MGDTVLLEAGGRGACGAFEGVNILTFRVLSDSGSALYPIDLGVVGRARGACGGLFRAWRTMQTGGEYSLFVGVRATIVP